MNIIQKHCLMSVITLFGLISANGVNTVNAEQRSLAAPMASTFRIRSRSTHGNIITTGHGTAFGVNLSEYGHGRQRYLMTACHVILERNGSVAPVIQLELKQNGTARWVKCRVVNKDSKLDVALLECETDLPAATKFASRDTLKGLPIVMIGSPGGVPLKITKGRVTENKRLEPSVAYVGNIQEGCSGGPVFDSSSQRVTGLVIAGIGNGSGHQMDPHTCLYVSLANIRRFVRRSFSLAGDGYASRHNPSKAYPGDASPNTFAGNADGPYSTPRRDSNTTCRAGNYSSNVDRSGSWLP